MLNNSFIMVAEAAAATQGGSLLGMFLPMILIMGVMYFLMIRPQKKREQEMRSMINALEVGDEVVTIGGVVGRVFNIQDDNVTIATSVQNTLLTFKKSAISQVFKKNDGKTAAPAAQEKADAEEKKPSFLEKILNKKNDAE